MSSSHVIREQSTTYPTTRLGAETGRMRVPIRGRRQPYNVHRYLAETLYDKDRPTTSEWNAPYLSCWVLLATRHVRAGRKAREF
jgi:hypothetical protein